MNWSIDNDIFKSGMYSASIFKDNEKYIAEISKGDGKHGGGCFYNIYDTYDEAKEAILNYPENKYLIKTDDYNKLAYIGIEGKYEKKGGEYIIDLEKQFISSVFGILTKKELSKYCGCSFILYKKNKRHCFSKIFSKHH